MLCMLLLCDCDMDMDTTSTRVGRGAPRGPHVRHSIRMHRWYTFDAFDLTFVILCPYDSIVRSAGSGAPAA